MSAPIIYCWNEETMIYAYSMEAQLDPLETEKAGYEVYMGLPNNGTYSEPLKEKKGYDIVWDLKSEGWKHKKQKKDEPEPHVPTELEIAYEDLYKAHAALEATDYRALKYIDGEYTEEEYAVYRAERSQLRKDVRDAQKRVDELEGK